MVKHIRKLAVALLILIAAFISTSATVLAETDELLKDKTNKLKISNDLKENAKIIKESLAAGKALTYKIEVSKGALYIDLKNDTDFKVEIYDSKNKAVKKIEGYEMYGGVYYVARDSVGLSKGKYKIKISPASKKTALNLDGKVAMINNASKSIALNQKYITAVTDGKSYKFTFELDEKATLILSNLITSYTPDEVFPFVPEFKLVNSEGKTVEKFDKENILPSIIVKKGAYTLVVKANKTGCLTR